MRKTTKRLLITVAILIQTLTCFCQLQRLPLKVEDMYPNLMTPLNDIANLFDDDPNTVFSIWSPPVNPVRFNVDLHNYSSYVINQIKVFWPFGNPSTYKLIGVRRDNDSEVVLYDHPGGVYQPYEQTIDLSYTPDIKMVIIQSQGGGDYPEYLKLYGSYTEKPVVAYQVKHYPLKNFMMVNCHQYDLDSAWWWKNPTETYNQRMNAIANVFTGVRVYDDAYHSTAPDGTYAFSPTVHGGFVPESMYRDLKKKVPGFTTLLTWQGPTDSIRQTYFAVKDSSSNLNIPYGLPRDSVSSWERLGRDGYVLGSRYGSNANVPDYPIMVPTDWWVTMNSQIKGSGLASWVEPYNEDDAFWDALHCLTTSQLYAGMSAFYDGHKGKLFRSGVKNADPNLIVSSGGMASGDTYILHEGRYWCIKNRGYRKDGTVNFPFDVYQAHLYPSDGSQYNGKPGGVTTESSLIKWMDRLVKAAHDYGDDVPVAVGEAGWDINPNSDINAPAHDGYTAEQVRAQQVSRTILKSSQTGLSALYWYVMVQDDNFADTEPYTIQFRSMGMMYCPDGTTLKRRTVSDHMMQLHKVMDYTFAEAIVDNDTMQVLRYTKDGAQDMYAAWKVDSISRDANGRSVWHERKSKYKLNITGTRLDFTNDSSGVFKETPYSGDSVMLSSEPILFIGTAFVTPLPVHVISFVAERVNKSVLLKWKVEDAIKTEVERSDDGVHFQKIGSTTSSQLLDLNPPYGKLFYRLKVYENSTKFVYSEIRSVVLNAPNQRVELYNTAGQLIRSGTESDIPSWKSRQTKGVYFLRYYQSDSTFITEKIEIL